MKSIAIITGASSGIGKVFTKTLSEHSKYDEVWVIARSRERLEELRNTVELPLRPIPLDLTKESSLSTLKELLDGEKPRISLLINCSGYGKFDSFENLSFEENMGMIELNVSALTALTYISLPYMDKGSEILNVASVAAFQPIPYIGVYGATKSYVLNFSRAIGRELKKRGIRVFAVCPFWTKTDFFDRAIDENKERVVKKYAAMYTPEYIVNYTWRAMKNKHKDHCIPGFKAKLQVLGVKLLPAKLIMNIWQSQQKLK